MTVASIVSVFLLAFLGIAFAFCLKKKDKFLALCSSCFCFQLVMAMTTIVFVFLMAQESVIYNNSLTGLYEAEGIDLFYMSKAAGAFGLVALAVSICAFIGALNNKKLYVFLPATLLLIVGVVVAILLFAKFAPTDYVDVLVPAAAILGWCLLCLVVNALFDGQKIWCKVVITVINTLNFLLVVAAIVSVCLLANQVVKSDFAVEGGMVIVLAIILLIFAAPSIITFVSSIKYIVKSIKERIKVK